MGGGGGDIGVTTQEVDGLDQYICPSMVDGTQIRCLLLSCCYFSDKETCSTNRGWTNERQEENTRCPRETPG